MIAMKSLILRTAALGALFFLSACGGGSGDSGNSVLTPPSYGGALVPGSVAMTITHKVKITTTLGVINIGLDATHAPLSAANFLAYVNSGFFVNTVFHRVVPGFVIQGGGFTDVGNVPVAKTTNAAIALESRNGLSNTAGTLGMARSSDPNSATSQFYINLVNNTSLNYPASDNAGYAVFGQVTDQASLDVVNAIAKLPTTTRGGYTDWPVTDVTVTAVVVTP